MARRTVVNLGGGVGVRTGELGHVLWGPIVTDDEDPNFVSTTAFSGEANSNGGDTTISTDQAMPGQNKSLKLSIDATGDVQSGTRLEWNPPYPSPSHPLLRGYPKQPNNQGEEFYAAGWYYFPSFVDDNPNLHFNNLLQHKVWKAHSSDWTDRERQPVLFFGPQTDKGNAVYTCTLWTNAYDPNGYLWDDDASLLQGDDIIAASDVNIPIAEWFHLEMYLKRGTQGNRDGEIAHWLNGQLLWHVHGIVTMPVHPVNAWVYDYTSGDYIEEGCNQTTFNHYRNNGSGGAQSVYLDNVIYTEYRSGPPLAKGAQGDGPRLHSRRFHDSWNSVSSSGSFQIYLTPGDDRMVLIFVQTESTSAQGNVAVSTVTCGGNTCTLLSDGTNSAAEGYQSGDWNRCEIWACKESDLPADGWQTVAVTMVSTVDEIIINSWVISGANQSYTVDTVALESRDAVSGWGSGSITTSAADVMIVDGVTSPGPQIAWVGPNQARMGSHRGHGTASLGGGHTSYRRVPTAGTYTMEWDCVTNVARLAHVIAAIAKA